MSKRRRLHVGSTVSQQISAIDEWWSVNRTAARRLFTDELDGAYELIRCQPNVGQPAVGTKSDRVRRIHLRRSRYYLYYQESEDGDAIEVLAVWHASRGQGPEI